ncbi:MAG: ribonuclease III [Alphaproteobacteria bacterium]|nr:ribonuclease III [Alphaproteobacteria bacterium]
MADLYSLEPSFHEDKIAMHRLKDLDLTGLMEKLGHAFAHPDLLRDALVHPSLSGGRTGRGKGQASPYERLEFLGDRVLGLTIAHWLFDLYPKAKEGELAKRHAALVSREALATVAERIGLADYILLAEGNDQNAPRKNLAASSDAMEGVIGALYLDGGLEVARALIQKYWAQDIDVAATPADPKTALQEYAQGKGLPLPVYKVVEHTGPSHAPCFLIEGQVKGLVPVRAEGGSKREAEKKVACALLEEITRNGK